MKLHYGSNFTCCYSYVTRNGSEDEPDVGIEISSCEPFNNDVLLTHDIVKVRCIKKTGKTSKMVYENVHNPIILKESVKDKMETTKSSTPLSVLIVVIDSMSRLNFIRSMKQTYTYLRQNKFVEMKGYTKINDNTLPNFMALLTGFDSSTTETICKPQTVGGLDECPMIWYDYGKAGYITAYAEDMTDITTFNYLSKGFVNPPTDYYFKPYMEATETLTIRHLNEMPYCTGPESQGERILNLAKDFVTTFKNVPTFGIFWMNSFSHQSVNAPRGMDNKVKNFFVNLKKKGVFNESIVIMLSDHGVRFGKIRTSNSGWYEERMPINMISVPGTFQEKFPLEYWNLVENSNKLTSTYDLFLTLEHILVLSGKTNKSREISSCPNCSSLFSSIPKDRTCMDAGIPPEWCTCMGHFRNIKKDHPYVKNATDLALDMIRVTSAQDPFAEFRPKLGQVLTASTSESTLLNKTEKTLFVTFHTKPKSVIFLVTVIFNDFVTSNSSVYVSRIDNGRLRDTMFEQ
ncbi:hypothetical protein Zmor_026209 [Zophobas morio]|uniref:DUF229 domain containing protein n=2 Tax=Zophobas morio TaxID=2755281 RepID=A0AA38HUY3_9CUCU|nr:hypothetical protein Zmor_026209 [Zophobas morio]